ncbi:citrate lyase holo-[acyl-carrier protein] synthase [Lactobacillus sp. ESL0785]|uniref:citrate lyase holo-[acyl-carrier protein] synthase n=1 Tax=Lactobacillus sp. ESL0785 TaxID=2983232 RepID=UPI002475C6CF|nr:citrate lyase holo-[acyl-carrier protein] synthase [Lactobacillus sp. ESL0785]
MTKSIFTIGKPQTIPNVLANKDQRVALQQQIFTRYPQQVLLDVKLNIPGPIKNNRYLRKLFAAGIQDLEAILAAKQLSFNLLVSWDKPSGCENFYLLTEDSQLVKQAAIIFEDQTQLGRLFDADVLVKSQNAALSRSKLGLKVRRCFICERPAKECARSRRHAVSELQEYINQIYAQKFN